MIIKLILRNVRLGLPRLWPMALALSLSLALLVVGNSISQVVSSGLEETYTQRITGHGSITLVTDQSFTIFGSEALLVGELITPSILPSSSQLFELLEQDPLVEAVAGALPVAARVEIASRPLAMALLGVDFADYPLLVPDLDFVFGGFPTQDQPGILIHLDSYHQITRLRGSSPQLGEPVVLSAAQETSFTIRELPLAGVFTHPVQDQALSRFGLVDADTARALNGFLYGITQDTTVDQDFDPFSFDDLFDTDGFADTSPTDPGMFDGSSDTASSSPPHDLFLSIESLLATPDSQQLSAGTTPPRTGVFTFLLIRFTPQAARNPQRALQQLQASLVPQLLLEVGDDWENNPSQVLDFRLWRSTAGGVALAVWVIQLLFTLGLVFVSFGAVVVTVNSLILSILERTKEIGTMRALGAQKTSLGWMITGETLVLVTGSGVFGILLGAGLVWVLNSLQIPLHNPLLSSLFRLGSLQGQFTFALFINHLSIAIGFGLFAALYPLKKALSITPVKAMSSQ